MKEIILLRNGEEVHVRTCTMTDLESLLHMQEKVILSLKETSFLQPLSTEEFTHLLNGHGFLLGAFWEGELIAFRGLLIPEVSEDDHLGREVGLSEVELKKVVYSEVSNVLPDFQGNGLQKILGKMMFNRIDQDTFRYVCATVAPFNIPSLIDKFAHQLQIVSLKEMYGGLLRFIFLRDFSTEEKAVLESKFIELGDKNKQQALLKEGWRGIQLKQIDGNWMVEYIRTN